MRIKLIVVGKTEADYIKEGLKEYAGRLKHYVNFEFVELAAIKNAKNLSQPELKKREGEELLKLIDSSAVLVLLDEKGKENTSTGFAKFIQQQMNSGIKTLVFFVGGAFGFSEEVYKRGNHKLALSQLTFSHQMVRLFFTEQLYRAFTIIKGESYHHD